MPTKQEIIDRLLKLAKVTHGACDNSVEDGEDGTSLDRRDYEAVCTELDALDQLPEVPGEAADGWRKAEYWLKQP